MGGGVGGAGNRESTPPPPTAAPAGDQWHVLHEVALQPLQPAVAEERFTSPPLPRLVKEQADMSLWTSVPLHRGQHTVSLDLMTRVSKQLRHEPHSNS